MAKIAPNKPRKGAAAARVTIGWGKFSVRVNGKFETVEGTSRIQKGLFDKLGIKSAATQKARVTVEKDKKGRERLKGVSRVIGSRYIEVNLGEWTETKSTGGKLVRRAVWYRVRVPSYVSLAAAYKVLKTGGKVEAVRWPNGIVFNVDETPALNPAT
jgi:hypothetical protein